MATATRKRRSKEDIEALVRAIDEKKSEGSTLQVAIDEVNKQKKEKVTASNYYAWTKQKGGPRKRATRGDFLSKIDKWAKKGPAEIKRIDAEIEALKQERKEIEDWLKKQGA